MSLPLFPPTEDPGPDFLALLRRADAGLRWGVPAGAGGAPIEVRHATTVCALRFADGVLMAGDRRATEANRIAHRQMDKVFPADAHSAIAIAGAAGPAMEMVKLFQVQLDHFEKVEGVALSLEGKANQLAQMVRAHLEMAMMGLAVVPLFAGYDLRRGCGRIFSYDVTGGRYEEADYQATGSGGRDARGVIKSTWREDLAHPDAVRLAVRALVEAADEDSATGGPDLGRRIYPVVATVVASGYEQVPEDEVASVCESVLAALAQEGAP